jgi:hypothetical protein
VLPRRRADLLAGRSALTSWAADPAGTPRAVIATAVRYTLHELAVKAPGNAVEVRVPPFGVVQCMSGHRHTRGTPPHVIETDPDSWLRLASGLLSWAEGVEQGLVHASGRLASLAEVLPLVPLPEADPDGPDRRWDV